MTPRDTRDELERAKLIARTGSMSARRVHDVKRFMEIEKSIDAALALLRAPETQDSPSRDFLLAENARLKAALKARAETQERGWQDERARITALVEALPLFDHAFYGVSVNRTAVLLALGSPPAQTEDR